MFDSFTALATHTGLATYIESECCDARDIHVATETTSDINEHIASIVNLDAVSLGLSNVKPRRSATAVAADSVIDENEGVPWAGFGTTDFAWSTDTRDDSRRLGVRELTNFFC